MRWKFTDLTHVSDLTIKVTDILPRNICGPLHCVQLFNQFKRAGKPLEVGRIITALAQPAAKRQVIVKILFHINTLDAMRYLSGVHTYSPHYDSATHHLSGT